MNEDSKDKQPQTDAAVGDKTAPVREKIKTSDVGLLTVSPSPHIKNHDTTRSVMIDVIIALIPALVWGVYVFGARVLTLTVLSLASCIGFEALTQKILRRPITVLDFSAAVTGLLLALNLPAAVPLWIPVVGGFFAIVIVKQLFGGIGKNVINPALAARVFLFAWPNEMNTFTSPGTKLSAFAVKLSDADVVATATPLSSLKTGALPPDSPFAMLIGNMGGSIGEVSALLLLAGGVYLLIRRVITWHIPVSFIATVAAISYLLPRNGADGAQFMVYELLSGGLIIGAVFMATDYSTSPVTPVGRIIYGVGCGLITVFIRYFGGYVEGVSFAILIMNLLVWYIDKFTRPARFGRSGEKNEKS